MGLAAEHLRAVTWAYDLFPSMREFALPHRPALAQMLAELPGANVTPIWLTDLGCDEAAFKLVWSRSRSLLGVWEVGGDVVACEALGRSRQPRFDDQLLQFVERDPLETDQHGGVAVEVRGREVDLGSIGEQGLLGNQVLDPCPEDRPCRRRVSERLEIGLAQRTLPHEPLVVHMPTLAAVHEALAGVR